MQIAWSHRSKNTQYETWESYYHKSSVLNVCSLEERLTKTPSSTIDPPFSSFNKTNRLICNNLHDSISK